MLAACGAHRVLLSSRLSTGGELSAQRRTHTHLDALVPWTELRALLLVVLVVC